MRIRKRPLVIVAIVVLLGSLLSLLASSRRLAAFWTLATRPSPLTQAPRRPDDDDNDRETPQVVRLASAELARRIGIETAPVVEERHRHHLLCNAETAYNGQRSAEVLARVPGIVGEVRVGLGQVVEEGEVLAVLDSSVVGTAKTQYRTALATVELAQTTYDRMRSLSKREIVAGKNELETLTLLTQAKNNLLDAEQKLRNFGFRDDDLQAIAYDKVTNLVQVLAPIDGHVIVWDATVGEAVEPTTQLFALADTSSMWLWIDVYEFDIALVDIGQPLRFTISGAPDSQFDGKITAISTEVNRITRTTRVRAEVANPHGRLRANQFGQARIEIGADHKALVAPAAAVEHDGQRKLVFVPDGPGVYRPREVITRPTDDADRVEVVRGLAAGEQVVTTGAFLLLSEMFKERIAEDVD